MNKKSTWEKYRDGYYDDKVASRDVGKKEYRKHVQENTDKLKNDLFEQYNISGPAAERVWSLAWEHGHADGMSEVISCFEDFVDILLEAKKQYDV